jgi:hypothetical protein
VFLDGLPLPEAEQLASRELNTLSLTSPRVEVTVYQADTYRFYEFSAPVTGLASP